MGTVLAGAVPVTIGKEELNKFEDPWDYRAAVHREPLLGNVDGNHSLPPAPKVSFLILSLRKGKHTQIEFEAVKKGLWKNVRKR